MSVDLLKKLEEIRVHLKNIGRYGHILGELSRSPESISPSYLFEGIFAHTMETKEVTLQYEARVNPENYSTVDFMHKKHGWTLAFELVSPDMSIELKKETRPIVVTNGVEVWGAELTSGHENEFLRPEAQTIRMQEKLLEKVKKFPKPADDFFSFIVVDCTNFHFGHIDSDDCRQIMYGCTAEPMNLEHWEGARITGLFENQYKKRSAKDLQERISGVLFLPHVWSHMFDEILFLPNFRRSKEHRSALAQAFKTIPILSKMKKIIGPPPYKGEN